MNMSWPLFPILVLLNIYIAGCSIPMTAKYTQIDALSSDKAGKKSKFRTGKPVKDFLGNEIPQEGMIAIKERVEGYISSHSDLGESTKNNLRALRLTEGATKEEVELLIGRPAKVIKLGNNIHAPSEAWLYRTNKRTAFMIIIIPTFIVYEKYYLYFKENVLVSMRKHYLKQFVDINIP